MALMLTRRRGVLLALLLVDAILLAWWWRAIVGPPRRLIDRVGLVPDHWQRQYNGYLEALETESGIDARVLLVPSTGHQPIEQFAVQSMRDLGIGRKTGGRGLLIVYDTLHHRMRLEIGPKLQGILPDAFVDYLLREHLRPFFEGGQPEVGLRTGLLMLHSRIRRARLGEEYDPAFEEYIRDVQRLATGGGASAG